VPINELDIFGAFLVGLLGVGHCLGMCGPVATLLSINLKSNSFSKQLPYLFLYNLGRITSYMVMGGIMALSAHFLAQLVSLEHSLITLRFLASVLIILTGFHLLNWLHLINKIERLGLPVWAQLKPIAQSFIPLQSPWQAFPFGLLWGWLPCGLVYTMLSWSLASGSFSGGALTMGAFGLGTFMPMLLIGLSGEKIKRYLKSPKIKFITGLTLICYGIYSFSATIVFFS